MQSAAKNTFSSLRGASRLAIDAVTGVTDIVEAMHRNIAGIAPVIDTSGKLRSGTTKGITGLVYRSVRGITRATGLGLDAALGLLTPLLRTQRASPRAEAVSAALNGVFGDYLAATANPLAISMQLRVKGQPLMLERAELATGFKQSDGRLLVLVHGLCMNDLQWQRDGHDHGAALAKDLGLTPLYLHYNTGQHIAANGAAFAALLEKLVKAWPVPVKELVIVCHSMGGLVTRGACHTAAQLRHTWPRRLKKIVFLGTPHHGAPLERAGNWVDILLGVSPYTAPFARLGKVRSAGIKDLRYGNFLAPDATKIRAPVPLPKGAQCFAIAATTRKVADKTTPSQAATAPAARLPGDGLVPVKSALGRHRDTALTLPIPASRQALFDGINHFQLLSSGAVYRQLRAWLG